MSSQKLQRRESLVATALVIFLTLTMLYLPIQPANAGQTHNIALQDFAFNPHSLIVPVDDTITWTNNDPVTYTLWFVNATDQTTYVLSDPIPPEESWSHTFNEYIILQCYSFEHLWIEGNITVTIPGDVNGDRIVDIFDIGTISAHWYPGPPVGPLGYDANADINNDGAVDIFDVGIASAQWGQTW